MLTYATYAHVCYRQHMYEMYALAWSSSFVSRMRRYAEAWFSAQKKKKRQRGESERLFVYPKDSKETATGPSEVATCTLRSCY